MQVGDTLEEFLVEATSDAKLRQTMMSLSEAVRTIAFKVCAMLPRSATTRACFSSASSNKQLRPYHYLVWGKNVPVFTVPAFSHTMLPV